VPVVLEMNIASTYFPMEPNSFNVVAEIPGSELPDEIVMIGAHLDSMHLGTGAIDNAAGCAVVLDAMRILQARRLKMRRTVRLVLWTGSEQGLQGSREYITQHFVEGQAQRPPGDARQFPSTRTTLSAYFDVDDGSGPIQGIYVHGNEAVAPIFEQWMAPFAAIGMTKVSLEARAGKDHASFDAAGLNGFHFMQQGADAAAELQHSNFDLYDRLNIDALAQNAAIVAAFAYRAANRAEPLPRKAASR
jgi:Zn-dependent M28 family amino/carboxypeptidase